MAVEFEEQQNGKVVVIKARGKLTERDYEKFGPEVERLIKKLGKIRVLFQMGDFHGWSLAGLWQDVKFDAKHFADIERIAFVGEKKWQKWVPLLCRFFTTAEIRYFQPEHTDRALQWVAA